MSTGRVNQKARTRAALLEAATELVREGRPPSIAEAAERAMVSAATAYRYFPSAEDLWFEASATAADLAPILQAADAAIEAAGDDVQARVEALVRTIGFPMLDDQAPFRRLAKAALDQWFTRAGADGDFSTPVREGRRNHHIALALAPLRDRLPTGELDRIAHALGVVIGTDGMLALTDGVGLDVDAAKGAMLDTARWIVAGALAELPAQGGGRSRRSSTPPGGR
jgi:AcrR family transcriptional regulator